MTTEFIALDGQFFFLDHDYVTGEILGFTAPGVNNTFQNNDGRINLYLDTQLYYLQFIYY
jgi:hypothetical protein